ncbi:hypothetical protein BH10BDE1_BH10BDE1_34050 [soil metagenome]
MLTHALAAAAISLAASSWYCESGDPSGGGPTADFEISTTGTYKLTVNYNRKNLESAARSSVYQFEGVATDIRQVRENGNDCTKATFNTYGERAIEFTTCRENESAALRLVNFTPLNPTYQITCQ